MSTAGRELKNGNEQLARLMIILIIRWNDDEKWNDDHWRQMILTSGVCKVWGSKCGIMIFQDPSFSHIAPIVIVIISLKKTHLGKIMNDSYSSSLRGPSILLWYCANGMISRPTAVTPPKTDMNLFPPCLWPLTCQGARLSGVGNVFAAQMSPK